MNCLLTYKHVLVRYLTILKILDPTLFCNLIWFITLDSHYYVI